MEPDESYYEEYVSETGRPVDAESMALVLAELESLAEERGVTVDDLIAEPLEEDA